MHCQVKDAAGSWDGMGCLYPDLGDKIRPLSSTIMEGSRDSGSFSLSLKFFSPSDVISG